MNTPTAKYSMTAYLKLFVFVIFFTFLCISGAKAQSCACLEQTEQEKKDNANAIFLGIAVNQTSEASAGLWNNFGSIKTEKFTDSTKHFFQGITTTVAQKISACNFVFEKDKIYRIYARLEQTTKGKPYLTTDSCSGTIEITAEEFEKAKSENSENNQTTPEQESTEQQGLDTDAKKN